MNGAHASSARGSPLSAWLLGGLLATAIVGIYLYGAHGFPLTEPDEARYAELGREMLVLGDWITPHLNYVKYFEKPPLVYWATAVSFATFGISELSARVPSLLSGIATVAVTVLLAARMYGASTALLTLPIIAIGPLFGFMAQVLVLDMALTWFMTLALAAIWGNRYRLAYVATALAILAKGPVAAILVGGIAFIFLLLHGGWPALRRALDGRGILLALAISLPWFLLVSWRNPEFVHFFVVDQHLERYLWTVEHGEPIWFFVPVIPLALGPWGLMLVLDPALLRAVLAPKSWSVPTRFLVIWAAVIVVFFSLSTSKLLTYVLPAMPPLAILTARALLLEVARGRRTPLARLAWLLMIAGPVLGIVGAVLPLTSSHWRAPLIAPYLIAGGPLVLVIGWATRRVLDRRGAFAALGVVAVGWLMVFALAVSGRGAANEYRNLGLAVATLATRPDDRVALYGSFTQSIGYYSQRRVAMIGGCGELRLANLQSDFATWFWPVEQVRGEWEAPGRLFLVINRKDLGLFDPPLDPPPTILASKGKKVLVVNR